MSGNNSHKSTTSQVPPTNHSQTSLPRYVQPSYGTYVPPFKRARNSKFEKSTSRNSYESFLKSRIPDWHLQQVQSRTAKAASSTSASTTQATSTFLPDGAKRNRTNIFAASPSPEKRQLALNSFEYIDDAYDLSSYDDDKYPYSHSSPHITQYYEYSYFNIKRYYESSYFLREFPSMAETHRQGKPSSTVTLSGNSSTKLSSKPPMQFRTRKSMDVKDASEVPGSQSEHKVPLYPFTAHVRGNTFQHRLSALRDGSLMVSPPHQGRFGNDYPPGVDELWIQHQSRNHWAYASWGTKLFEGVSLAPNNESYARLEYISYDVASLETLFPFKQQKLACSA